MNYLLFTRFNNKNNIQGNNKLVIKVLIYTLALSREHLRKLTFYQQNVENLH